MKKLLVFDAAKCVGCRTCEVACSLTQTGVCNPASSRRRVIHFTEAVLDVPMQCQHCDNAACMNICPVKAISLDGETGAKVIDYDKCIGCKMCMIACPFGAISVDPLSNKVMKCDLCVGDPACARFCPTAAIEYVTADVYGLTRQKAAAAHLSKMMTPAS